MENSKLQEINFDLMGEKMIKTIESIDQLIECFQSKQIVYLEVKEIDSVYPDTICISTSVLIDVLQSIQNSKKSQTEANEEKIGANKEQVDQLIDLAIQPLSVSIPSIERMIEEAEKKI